MSADNSQQDLFIDAPVWWEGLTRARRLFVEYYCTDTDCFLNPTAAYIKAYTKNGKELTDSSIQSNAFRMMRDTKIQGAITKLLQANQVKEDHLNEYRLLKALQTLAFYNPKDLIDKYGNLKKEFEEMGDLALCVAGIKSGRNSKEIKLYDRTKAIELLMRYLELVRPAEGIISINPNVYLSDKDMEQLRVDETKNLPVPTAEDAQYEVVEA
jgi:phage terminase small subunit